MTARTRKSETPLERLERLIEDSQAYHVMLVSQGQYSEAAREARHHAGLQRQRGELLQQAE